VYWIGVITAAAAVACCAWAVWPRYSLERDPEIGVTYWGHLAEYQDQELVEEALAERGNAHRRISNQIMFVSSSVLAKYRLVRAALICSAGAGCLLFVAVALIT
jgi:hypothetical protein